MLRFFSIVVMIWSLAGFALGQDPARMDQLVQSYVTNGDFMGSVLVARDEKILLSNGYGLANAEWNISNTPEARFRIASITKQFTAAAILLLEERGKLKVEDSVKKYLPDAPASWEKITIFHLLTHTAGFPELVPSADSPPNETAPLERAVARIQARPLSSAPGDVFRYSNQSYYVLGHLVEKISGERFEIFLQENILAPAGMKDSGFDSASVLTRRANMYDASRSGLVNSYPLDRIVPNTASGMYSTTEDLLRWQLALFGGTIVSSESLQKMTRPFKGDYGFGLYVRTVDGRKLFRHAAVATPHWLTIRRAK
jgi:CubicO group peptidase (beta-lactamase class C family)